MSAPCRVVDKIETIFENIATSILNDNSETVMIIRRRTATSKNHSFCSSDARSRKDSICFPGTTKHEAWQFSIVLRILSLIHDAITSGSTTTKRDMYYKDPKLFLKQSVVDRYVDDIAFTLGCPRAALNVVAAAKGLCAGLFTLTHTPALVKDASNCETGSLIPHPNGTDKLEVNGARFVLVIEKEATFNSLLCTPVGKALLRQAVFVTGKGYPDIATRAFVRRLSACTARDSTHPLPIYGLMDYDPDGIAILSTYKFGSRALSHESETLVIPCMKWLGISSSDFNAEYPLIPQIESTRPTATECDTTGLMLLSVRDRRKAISMLCWQQIDADAECSCRRELQVMLVLGLKAEIQFLDGQKAGLQEWILRKLESL